MFIAKTPRCVNDFDRCGVRTGAINNNPGTVVRYILNEFIRLFIIRN
jgi:hypothetical protein